MSETTQKSDAAKAKDADQPAATPVGDPPVADAAQAPAPQGDPAVYGDTPVPAPVVGAPVHFWGGTAHPIMAHITFVRPNGRVNLICWPNGARQPLLKDDVMHSATPEVAGRWSWPEVD